MTAQTPLRAPKARSARFRSAQASVFNSSSFAPFSWVHILRSKESEFKVGLQSMDVTEQCRAYILSLRSSFGD